MLKSDDKVAAMQDADCLEKDPGKPIGFRKADHEYLHVVDLPVRGRSLKGETQNVTTTC